MTAMKMTDLALFSGRRQFENFARFKDILPVSRMAAASEPFPCPMAIPLPCLQPTTSPAKCDPAQLFWSKPIPLRFWC